MAPRVDGGRLAVTLLAFFLAVGVAADALTSCTDDHCARRYRVPSSSLSVSRRFSGRCSADFVGVVTIGWGLLAFIARVSLFVLGYNLELFNGWMHSDIGFAAAWGSFPVLVVYYVQAESVGIAAVIAAIAAFGLSLAQRSLSTSARGLRRQVATVSGTATRHDGTVVALNSNAAPGAARTRVELDVVVDRRAALTLASARLR